jgi:hypothetical protein
MLRLPLAARCWLAPTAWCADVPVLPEDGTLAAAKAVGAVKPQRTAIPFWGSLPHTPRVMSLRRISPVRRAAGRAGLRTFTATCAGFGAHLAAVGRMARK